MHIYALALGMVKNFSWFSTENLQMFVIVEDVDSSLIFIVFELLEINVQQFYKW